MNYLTIMLTILILSFVGNLVTWVVIVWYLEKIIEMRCSSTIKEGVADERDKNDETLNW